ncbi:MAG: glycosyltransferase family 4 protein [Ignavibacteriales bacterium]|nr:glycosyltransferase family 4 protein [Ignavibacteriales bacterium]
MNILFISPDFNYSCGVSRYMNQCLQHFSEQDYFNVHFITNRGDSLDRISDNKDIKLHLLNFEKDHKNPFKLIKDFFQLLSYCKKYKIQIIHTHHRYPELISVLVSKITGAKTITTVHSFVSGLKKLSFRSDKIICVSNAVKKNLIEDYPHCKNRITVLYNCVDDSFFENISNLQIIRNKFGFSPDDKIILFVGRICRIKGVDILIKAFAKIIRLNENIKLILLGQVEDIIISEAIKGSEKYIFVIQPVKDVREYYQASDIVVLPSRIDPFPYVMLEAGAMKKPFIGGDTGGISEFIEDGVNGILIERDNYDQLADRIVFLLNNPVQAEILAEALYHKVRKECDCEKFYERLGKIYNDMLD